MTPIEADFNLVSHEHFKAVNHEHRGVRYEKHSRKLRSGTSRFISDAACPKCGEYIRVWRGQRNGEKTSACKGCQTEKKNKESRYLNKDNAITIDQRRAIEAHQDMQRDKDEWSLDL